jgi:hypothetical protein
MMKRAVLEKNTVISRLVSLSTKPWYLNKTFVNKNAPLSCFVPLKVPKREIFARSDFPDFYTRKPLRVGDFGVKIKKNFKIFWGSFRGAKFLTRMLSLFLRRFFSKFWPKIFFSFLLLRPLVSVNNDFLKFFIF